MGAPTPVQSASGVCVLHRLRSVNEAATCKKLGENPAFFATLVLVDMILDRVPQRHLRAATSATLLSTQPSQAAASFFHLFIGSGALALTFARAPPGKRTSICPAWTYGPSSSERQRPALRTCRARLPLLTPRTLPEVIDIDSLVAWTPPCAMVRARVRSQGAPNHPLRDAHACATRRRLLLALGRSILRSRPRRSRCLHSVGAVEGGLRMPPQYPRWRISTSRWLPRSSSSSWRLSRCVATTPALLARSSRLRSSQIIITLTLPSTRCCPPTARRDPHADPACCLTPTVGRAPPPASPASQSPPFGALGAHVRPMRARPKQGARPAAPSVRSGTRLGRACCGGAGAGPVARAFTGGYALVWPRVSLLWLSGCRQRRLYEIVMYTPR